MTISTTPRYFIENREDVLDDDTRLTDEFVRSVSESGRELMIMFWRRKTGQSAAQCDIADLFS